MSGADGKTNGSAGAAPELVTITIDGKQFQAAKGANLIDAARAAGVEIPFYCYHPHLSVAGNCRMCQVSVKGQPKLQIACNMTASEGLEIQTQFSSSDVADAQRATLEFLLINHPLDCTVCDQAGHCKLQDYHYQYNAKGSRFIEQKVNKVKAEPLGPEVVYDGERCIMCTRCVRFCDEVTKTSELGAFNRGDRGVIGVFPGRELTNPLSGTVVDLCPVGALTHERWRFNSRYWYANESQSICPGCSTGCNVKAAVRDDVIVQVKGRLNSEVNKEWLCDEGRYGFDRFQPPSRMTEPYLRRDDGFVPAKLDDALAAAAKLKSSHAEGETAVFLSPFLTTEEMLLALEFCEQVMGLPAGTQSVCVQIRKRSLTKVQEVLISPDYAPNARAFSLFVGDPGESSWRNALEARYDANLARVRGGGIKRLLLIGDEAIRPDDIDERLSAGISKADVSVAITPWGFRRKQGGVKSVSSDFCRVLLPGRTVNEKSGVLVNRDMRFQRLKALLTPPVGSLADWMIINRIAVAAGKPMLKNEVSDDRALFREMIRRVPDLGTLTLSRIGPSGVSLSQFLQKGEGHGEGKAVDAQSSQ